MGSFHTGSLASFADNTACHRLGDPCWFQSCTSARLANQSHTWWWTQSRSSAANRPSSEANRPLGKLTCAHGIARIRNDVSESRPRQARCGKAMLDRTGGGRAPVIRRFLSRLPDLPDAQSRTSQLVQVYTGKHTQSLHLCSNYGQSPHVYHGTHLAVLLDLEPLSPLLHLPLHDISAWPP
jgi:hypothetical protein